MATKKKVTNKAIPKIVPSIVFVNDDRKHAMIELFEGPAELMPVMKSVGLVRVPGRRTYMAYTLHTKGNQIIQIDVSEPDRKLIAEDDAKMSFVQNFLNLDFDEDIVARERVNIARAKMEQEDQLEAAAE